MTLQQLYEQVGALIAAGEGLGGYGDLDVFVAIQISHRRKTYFPLVGLWRGKVGLPNSEFSHLNDRFVIELCASRDESVTINN